MNAYPPEVLDTVRKNLEEEKTKLVARIDELSKQDPFADTSRLSDNAAIDAEANEESSHDRFAAMVDELTIQLTQIDDALFRISDGSYGFCKKCGAMIDTDRLKLLPYAEFCMSCEQAK